MQSWSQPPHKKSKVAGRGGGDDSEGGSEGDETSQASSIPVAGGGKKAVKVKGKGGSSCHQCKSRRNFTALTYCTSNLDKKNKKCRKKFCGHCLKKFYKENAADITEGMRWRCPSCRKICCCAACRRRKQRDLENGNTPGKPKPPKSKSKSKKKQFEQYAHQLTETQVSLQNAPP
jgi:hypothetical protein